MITVIKIIGGILFVLFSLATIFMASCAKGEREKECNDGSWVVFRYLAIFMFVVAAYCAISVFMIR